MKLRKRAAIGYDETSGEWTADLGEGVRVFAPTKQVLEDFLNWLDQQKGAAK